MNQEIMSWGSCLKGQELKSRTHKLLTTMDWNRPIACVHMPCEKNWTQSLSTFHEECCNYEHGWL